LKISSSAIKARHPAQYPGENLELLGADFRKDARELTTAGQYDHNLTLSMMKIFLQAGGSGNEDYRFPLRTIKQQLDEALLEIGYKEKTAANAYMVELKLTYKDICRHAEETYRTLLDRKEWPPARNARDTRTPPAATYGHLATTNHPTLSTQRPDDLPITRAEVMNLVLQHQTNSSSAPKGNCHKCGKAGHWSRNCPDNSNSSRNANNNKKPNSDRRPHSTSNPNSHSNHTNNNASPSAWNTARNQSRPSWRHTPPNPGSATTKKVKERTFNWCDKCASLDHHPHYHNSYWQRTEK
jgi:hypothetical protein